MSSWNNLSMRQRADIMKLAIDKGIYDLDTIKGAYNEFAKGGNLYELGGPKSNSYDKPQTFVGRVAQVLGASPHNSRGMDIVSSVVQTLPKASPAVSALDLGYDLNRAYHGENGALADAGLDILGMLPYISKGGIKAGRGILDVVRGNEKLRKAWNISAGTAKASDFISDTLGADRTSDVNNKKKSLGGNLYPYGGTKKKAFLTSLNNFQKDIESTMNLFRIK
jgi:hypothetical protein